MQRWLKFIIVFIAVQLSTTAVSYAEQPVIRIGVPEDFAPFYFQDKDGEFKGASYEVVAEILKSLGYRIEVTRYPSMRQLLAEIAVGQEDIVVNLTATDQRRKVALFTTTPHIYESQDVIVRADSQIRYDGKLLQLSPYRIGTIFGWTYGPDFDNAEYLNREYVNNSQDQVKGLLAGDFDMVINNKQFVHAISQHLGVSAAFKALDIPVFVLPVTIAVSKVHPEAQMLVDALEREVVKFRSTQTFKDILISYGFEPDMLPKGGSL